MNHQDITGRSAVHPFAYVQATDPALDPLNVVAANKAWLDTSLGTPILLKIRNSINTAWTTVLSGAGARPALPFTELDGPWITTSVLALPMGRAVPLPVTLLTHL